MKSVTRHLKPLRFAKNSVSGELSALVTFSRVKIAKKSTRKKSLVNFSDDRLSISEMCRDADWLKIHG